MMAASLDPAKMTDLAQIRAALERLQEAEVVRARTQPHPFLDSHVNNTEFATVPNWLARHLPTHAVPSHHGFRTDPPSLAVPLLVAFAACRGCRALGAAGKAL